MRKLVSILLIAISSVCYAQHNINICLNGNVAIYNVDGLPNSTYEWNITGGGVIINNISNNTISITFPDSNATYNLSVIETSEFGCIGEEQKIPIVVTGCFYYYIPNAFTVNNDALNEVFNIEGFGLSDVYDYRMDIYNRWGQLLFTTSNINVGWNGKYNYADAKQDVYTYKVEFVRFGKSYYEIGQVNLLR